jgi:hypothetical protein
MVERIWGGVLVLVGLQTSREEPLPQVCTTRSIIDLHTSLRSIDPCFHGRHREVFRWKKLEALGIHYDFPGYASAVAQEKSLPNDTTATAPSNTDIEMVVEDDDQKADKPDRAHETQAKKEKDGAALENEAPDEAASTSVSKDESSGSLKKRKKDEEKKELAVVQDQRGMDKMDIEAKEDQVENVNKERPSKKRKKKKKAKNEASAALETVVLD